MLMALFVFFHEWDINIFVVWSFLIDVTAWMIHCVLQECPTGVVKEDTFKDIYAQFFPQGGTEAANCL